MSGNSVDGCAETVFTHVMTAAEIFANDPALFEAIADQVDAQDAKVQIKFRKRSTTGWYVDVDGTQAGWTCKSYDGTWDFWATVHKPLEGNCLIRGCATRRDAVMEGLSHLSAYHGGMTWRLNMETVTDEAVFIPTAKLRQAWEQLLDEKFPEA